MKHFQQIQLVKHFALNVHALASVSMIRYFIQ